MGTAMNRLLWWHWLLIGVGSSLILFLILYFAMIRPKTLDAKTANDSAQATEDAGGTDQKIQDKEKELAREKLTTKKVNEAWMRESVVYMPNIQFDKDPLRAYEKIQYNGSLYANGKVYGVKDLPTEWGKWITGWYASQAKDGVVALTGFPIEAFSPDPNDVSHLNAIAFPQGKPWAVEVVAKNFDAAMAHLARFNYIKKHGMPVVNNVALSGQSPDLHVRYDLQFFVIPPTAPPPPDPKINATGAPAGGAGGGQASPLGGGRGGAGGAKSAAM